MTAQPIEPAARGMWGPDPVRQRLANHTIEDVLALPDDAPRVELRDGVLVVVPSPTIGHQNTGNLLWMWLRQHAPAEPDARSRRRGGDQLPQLPRTRRRPAQAAGGVDHHYFDAEQVVLAVEVVSPGTRRRDRLEKPADYADAGIPHYWRIEQNPVHVYAYRPGRRPVRAGRRLCRGADRGQAVRHPPAHTGHHPVTEAWRPDDEDERRGAVGPVKVRVPAKVNLHLGVGPLRRDGYHELNTVYHAISIYDELTARRGDTLALTMEGEGTGELALDDTNLVIRAAHALAGYAGVPPHARLHLRKQIPLAGGLAGGSADAAVANAATGQATGERDLLTQVQSGVRQHPRVPGEGVRGADHQVGVVQGQLAGALTLHGQREGVAPAGRQLVVDRDGVVDRVQLVVAVPAQRAHPEVQVDLRGHPHPHRADGPASLVVVRSPGLGHGVMSRTRRRMSNGLATISSSAVVRGQLVPAGRPGRTRTRAPDPARFASSAGSPPSP